MNETSMHNRSNPSQTVSSRTTLIVGDGYVGSALADRLAKDAAENRSEGLRQQSPIDDTIVVTSRSLPRQQSATPIRSGVLGVHLDVTDPRTYLNLESLGPIDRMIYCVGYRRGSNSTRDDVHVIGLRRLLQFLQSRAEVSPSASSSARPSEILPHVISLSTTGVYHQTGGQWVDELSPTRPQREGAKTHLRSESVLRRVWPHDRQTILRLAGIYGPKRWPNRSAIASGKPVVANPDSYLNLIHRDDIVSTIIATWQKSAFGMYCVADDFPPRRRDYYNAVARSVGLRQATFDTSDCIGGRRSNSNKRICNRWMKRDLVHQLQHPCSLEVVANLRH